MRARSRWLPLKCGVPGLLTGVSHPTGSQSGSHSGARSEGEFRDMYARAIDARFCQVLHLAHAAVAGTMQTAGQPPIPGGGTIAIED